MRPVGIQRDIEVHQLLSAEPDLDWLSDHYLEQYEDALAYFERGDWEKSTQLLNGLPESDAVKNFLRGYINQRKQPSDDWDGVIELAFK